MAGAPNQTRDFPVLRTVTSPSSRDVYSCPHHRLREGVLLVVAQDGSGRLLDLAGDVCAVSPSGALMLEAALGHEINVACQLVASQFKVDVERVRADMQAFLAALQSQRLLIAPGHIRSEGPAVSEVLCWLFAVPIWVCTHAPGRLILFKAWMYLTLAFLSTRLFGWPATVRVWNEVVSVRPSGRPAGAADTLDLLNTIDRQVARAVASHPLQVSCKERALCCNALARAVGANSRIVLGVDFFPFALHSWCECDSRILADQYEGKCDRFVPVMVYS